MGAQSRCTSITISPLVVTNFTRNRSGALAFSRSGCSSGLSTGAFGAAGWGGAGGWANITGPLARTHIKPFMQSDYKITAAPDARVRDLKVEGGSLRHGTASDSERRCGPLREGGPRQRPPLRSA